MKDAERGLVDDAIVKAAGLLEAADLFKRTRSSHAELLLEERADKLRFALGREIEKTAPAEPGRVDHQGMKTVEEAAQAMLDRITELSERSPYKSAFGDLSTAAHQLRAALNAARGAPTPVPRQPYEAKRTQQMGDRNAVPDVREKHESFGLILFGRSQGSPTRLFGSSVLHQHTFSLTITRAERISGQFGEQFFGNDDVVRVRMTAAQFVEAITAIGQGCGVPCTIERVEGVAMDPCPEGAGSDLRIIAENFGEQMEQLGKTFETNEKELDGLLAKKSLTKDDKQRIKEAVYRARRFFLDSAPFAAKVFGRQTEQMIQKGRTEVESFLRLALEHAGIKSIKDADGRLVLGTGEDQDGARR